MRKSLWAGVSAVVLTAAGGAIAADGTWTEGAEAEVIVTGQRQAYRGGVPVREIPQSITLIDAERLDRAGVTRLADALDFSASTARQNNFGGLWESYAVRGFAGDENMPSGYLVNGFNAGRGFGGPRDASSIARVEILKGPNAALFGRGEPGGSVNLVTKRPGPEHGGEATLRLGSWERYRGTLDWNQPLGSIGAVRLVGFYEEAGSFRDTVESERRGATPSVFLRLTPNTTVTYELEATRQSVPFDRGVVALNGRLGDLPPGRFLGEPRDGGMKAAALGHQLQLQHDFNPDWSLLLGAARRDTDLEGYSSEPELAASRQRLYVDGRSLSRQYRFRDYEATHQVLRAELGGRFEGPLGAHNLIIGVDHDRFDNDQFFQRSRPPLLSTNPTAQQGYVIDVFTPVYGAHPRPTLALQTDRLDEQRSWGAYVQDQVRVTDRVSVRLGARFDDFDQTSTNRATGVVRSFGDTRVSPSAGVSVRVADAATVFAGYGEGFRPNFGADAAGEPFEPETSRSTEAGVKLSLIGGALEATASVFDMRKTNVLTADPLNAGFSVAIGEARSRGLELELAGRLPGGLDLWASYAFTDATVARDGIDAGAGVPIRVGDRLINIPEHAAALQVSKRLVAAGRPATLGGGVRYAGERLGETGTSFHLPEHTLVRLFGSIALTERVELRGVVDNLFDTRWYPNSYARLWVAAGAPREASVALRWRF